MQQSRITPVTPVVRVTTVLTTPDVNYSLTTVPEYKCNNKTQDVCSIIGTTLCVLLISGIVVSFGVTYQLVLDEPVDSVNCTVVQYTNSLFSDNCDLRAVNTVPYYTKYAYCPKGYNENDDTSKIYTCYVSTYYNIKSITGSKFNAQRINSGDTGNIFIVSCVFFAVVCIAIIVCIIILMCICACNCKNTCNKQILPIISIIGKTNGVEIIGDSTDNEPNNDISVEKTTGKFETIGISNDSELNNDISVDVKKKATGKFETIGVSVDSIFNDDIVESSNNDRYETIDRDEL